MSSIISENPSAPSCTEDIESAHYVFGHLRTGAHEPFPTLIVARPTPDGWRIRSTDQGYNHDYVCYESFEDVMEWLDNDLSRPFLCRDRNEVLNVLTSAGLTTGFLLPGDCPSQHEEADRVLRHLETAWGVAPECCTPE